MLSRSLLLGAFAAIVSGLLDPIHAALNK